MPRDTYQEDPRREASVKVREREVGRLLSVGLLPHGRRGADQGATRLPAFVGGDVRTGFLALADRLIVPSANVAERARRQLPELIEGLQERPESRVVELRITDPGALIRAVRLLRGLREPVAASPEHLFSNAQTSWKVREGTDPELPVTPLGAPANDRGAGRTVVVVDNGVAEEALGNPWMHDIQVDADDLDELRTYQLLVGGPPPERLDLAAGHGTSVTGVIRQQAPGATVRIVRVLDSDGWGTEEDIANGIRRAGAMNPKPDVINLSLGGYTLDDEQPVQIVRALDELDPDILVVAAAGNEFTSRPIYPGSLPRVEAVAALDTQPKSGSPFAPQLTWYTNRADWIDVSAVGEWTSVYVTGDENPIIETDGRPEQFTGEATAGGTSFAAAAVTGAVVALASDSDISAREAYDQLRGGGVAVPGGGQALDLRL